MQTNIHASCVSLQRKGVLLLGDSKAGKSDMILRLIELCQAKLVADDRVDISLQNNQIKASCPQNLAGLLEVRGVGIVKYPYQKQTTIKLVVQLTAEPLERMPEKQFYTLGKIQIPLLYINPFENSAPLKVKAALRLL